MKQLNFTHFLLLALFVLIASFVIGEARNCYPSGQVKGKRPPNNQCNRENDSDCCKEGEPYNIYYCSPSKSNAILTLNSFEKGGDGGGPSKCDNHYHSNSNLVVALSTGWFRFNNNKRCMNQIIINGNGRSVKAMVVDECDSTIGCDEEHSYQPPCPNNIVDASKAVWNALGVKKVMIDMDIWKLVGMMLDFHP